MTAGHFSVADRLDFAIVESTRDRIRIIQDVRSSDDAFELPLPGDPVAICTARLGSEVLDGIVVRTLAGEVHAIRPRGGGEFDPPRLLASGIVGEHVISTQLDGGGPSELILDDSNNARLVVLRPQGEGLFAPGEIALPGTARFVSVLESEKGATAIVAAAQELDAVWILARDGETFSLEATISTAEWPNTAALLPGGNALVVVGGRMGPAWVESFSRADDRWKSNNRYEWSMITTSISTATHGSETSVLLTSPEHYEITTLTALPDGTMTPPSFWDAAAASTGLLIDVDGDGLDDVVLPSSGGKLIVLDAVAKGRYGVRRGLLVGGKPTNGVLVESGDRGPLALVIREIAGDVVSLSLETGEVTRLAATGDWPGDIALLSDPKSPNVTFAVSHRLDVEGDVRVFEWQVGEAAAKEIASLDIGVVFALTAADLDGDGWQDLAAAMTFTSELVIAFGGDTWDVRRFETVFSPSAVTALPCGESTCLAMGDFAGAGVLVSHFEGRQQNQILRLPAPEGVMELVAGHGGLAAACLSAGSAVLSEDPFGGAPLKEIARLGGARSLAMLDLNGDTTKNIAISGAWGDVLLVAFDEDEGGWIERALFRGGGDSFRMLATDINRDGTADLVIFNQLMGTVSTVLGHCGEAAR